MPAQARVVLFIVTSFWAYGELAIATEFAGRMAGTGFRPLFLIPPSHRKLLRDADLPHQVLIPGSGKLNRLQLQDIQLTHRPVLVVLADFMNFDFCERHYGLRRADLEMFSCPVGTFDNFSWGRDGAWLDTYGFKARYEGDISMDGLSFRLRPCPLNDPSGRTDEPGVYPYPLLADAAGRWLAARAGPAAARVRAELDIPVGRPAVLLTCATWQQMHAAYPRVKAYVQACTAMVERLVCRVLEHADVVLVGPSTLFPDGAPTGFRALGQVTPSRFQDVAAAVDLHVSNNIVSVSLHRLALAGIPTVNLYSALTKRGGVLGTDVALSGYATAVVGAVDYLYPFRMFPVGWYHFLDSLLAGNPFTDLVAAVELFGEESSAETVLALLSPGQPRRQVEAARQAYLHALDQLPGVGTILSELTTWSGG